MSLDYLWQRQAAVIQRSQRDCQRVDLLLRLLRRCVLSCASKICGWIEDFNSTEVRAVKPNWSLDKLGKQVELLEMAGVHHPSLHLPPH
jgi:hypothetical protein